MTPAATARFLPDSNCLIAAVSAWHPYHAAAGAEINRRLRHGEGMVVAAPALVEAYAVLTRLPAPYRLSPADAHRVLDASFVARGSVVVLDGPSYLTLLRRIVEAGVSGGRTYDAVIAACAARAGVRTLLTFNARDFLGLVGPGLEIVVPAR